MLEMASKSSVRVAVSVRPLNEREQENGEERVVWTRSDEVRVLNPESRKEKVFKFDHTFCSEPKEDTKPDTEILEDVGQFVLSSCFSGYNTCVFSYGACDSGKSYVMYGTDKFEGLTPWICKSLFKKASGYDDDTSFRAEISFLEIHKEFVKDLLGRRRNWQDSLRVREHRELGVYVDKLTKHIVTDVNEVIGLIDKGRKNRSICSRASNSLSSSSHTIFTIRFTQARLEGDLPCEMVSVIQLVDLAGSKSIHNEMDEGKTVILISKIELLENQSLLSAPLPPRSDYGNSQYPEMPWLDCETVSCNCSRFPELHNVILCNVSTPPPLPEITADVRDEESSDETPAASANENDNLDLEVPLYSEYVKLKGCTYHEHFQVALKSCKLKQQAGEEIPLRLFYEPRNVADENAVVAQVQLRNQDWISIGYIPGKKVKKILDALLAEEIKIVKFKKIEYSYIWSISQFKYIPTLVVIKLGRWPRDNDSYSYND